MHHKFAICFFTTIKSNSTFLCSIQPIHRESVGSNIKISYERTLVNMLSPTNTAEGQFTMKPSVFHSQGLMRNQTILEEFHIRQAKPSCGQQSNTVVIIFSFYGASEKAINSYCRLYHAYGFDAVVVPSYLKHFAWPAVSQELATDLLKFIKKTCGKYENIVIHAFSMGAYNFTVCMSEMYSSPEMYSSIENRIRAVVYDSLTLGTLKNMAKGVGMGVSKNSIIRTVIPLSMSLYFRLTSKYTVQVYEYYIQLFKQKPLQVPTLLFYCKNDPMSEYDVVQALVEDWRKRFSFELMTKSWERSIHSGHLLQHKEEYTKAVDKFLKNVCLLVKIDSKM